MVLIENVWVCSLLPNNQSPGTSMSPVQMEAASAQAAFPTQKDSLGNSLQISKINIRKSCSCIRWASINDRKHQDRYDNCLFSVQASYLGSKVNSGKRQKVSLYYCYVRLAVIPAFRASRHTLWKETIFSALYCSLLTISCCLQTWPSFKHPKKSGQY